MNQENLTATRPTPELIDSVIYPVFEDSCYVSPENLNEEIERTIARAEARYEILEFEEYLLKDKFSNK